MSMSETYCGNIAVEGAETIAADSVRYCWLCGIEAMKCIDKWRERNEIDEGSDDSVYFT